MCQAQAMLRRLERIEKPTTKVTVKIGINEIMKLPVSALEDIVAEENKNRIFSGDTDGGTFDLLERVVLHGLFLRGFDEE